MQKLLLVMITFLLTACSGLEFPGVYKIAIEQGNVVTQDMVDQLKPGLSKSQVEFIMGSAMLKDTFNNNRWDYLYSIRRGDDPRKQHRLSIFFDEPQCISGEFVKRQCVNGTLIEGKLKSYSGDFHPSSVKK